MAVTRPIEPQCIACGIQRKLTISVPVTEDYSIGSYECPKCKAVLRLVELRESTDNPLSGRVR